MALTAGPRGHGWFVGMTGGRLFGVAPMADRAERLASALEGGATAMATDAADALRWRAAMCSELVRVATDDITFDAELRARVGEALQAEGDDPDRMATEAMDILHASDSTRERFEVALSKLRYARGHITPARGIGLEAVEAALLYRLGDLPATVAMLDQLTEHPKMLGLARVLTPALRALCHHRNGAAEQARAAYQQLRELVASDRWRNQPRAKAWLAEVEAALGVTPTPDANRTPGERPR